MQIPIHDIAIKMAEAYQGSVHDTDHFLKVWAWARVIADQEALPPERRDVLEVAAVLHDIACPRCREKYGHAAGPLQEAEGMPMTRELLAEFCLPVDFVEQVVWLVGHHHTITPVKTMEHRILLEADFLVNAGEQQLNRAQIEAAEKSFFRTKSGTALLHSLYLRP